MPDLHADDVAVRASDSEADDDDDDESSTQSSAAAVVDMLRVVSSGRLESHLEVEPEGTSLADLRAMGEGGSLMPGGASGSIARTTSAPTLPEATALAFHRANARILGEIGTRKVGRYATSRSKHHRHHTRVARDAPVRVPIAPAIEGRIVEVSGAMRSGPSPGEVASETFMRRMHEGRRLAEIAGWLPYPPDATDPGTPVGLCLE
jgi:hypothetical protein